MVASRCIWEIADVLAESVEALTNPVEDGGRLVL